MVIFLLQFEMSIRGSKHRPSRVDCAAAATYSRLKKRVILLWFTDTHPFRGGHWPFSVHVFLVLEINNGISSECTVTQFSESENISETAETQVRPLGLEIRWFWCLCSSEFELGSFVRNCTSKELLLITDNDDPEQDWAFPEYKCNILSHFKTKMNNF